MCQILYMTGACTCAQRALQMQPCQAGACKCHPKSHSTSKSCSLPYLARELVPEMKDCRCPASCIFVVHVLQRRHAGHVGNRAMQFAESSLCCASQCGPSSLPLWLVGSVTWTPHIMPFYVSGLQPPGMSNQPHQPPLPPAPKSAHPCPHLSTLKSS